MGHKVSKQTNKNLVIAHFMYLLGQDTTIYIYIHACLDELYLPLFFKLTYISYIYFFHVEELMHF